MYVCGPKRLELCGHCSVLSLEVFPLVGRLGLSEDGHQYNSNYTMIQAI